MKDHVYLLLYDADESGIVHDDAHHFEKYMLLDDDADDILVVDDEIDEVDDELEVAVMV